MQHSIYREWERHALSLKMKLLLVVFCAIGYVQAQEMVFKLSFEEKTLELDTNYFCSTLDDSIQFSRMQFYWTPIAKFSNEEFYADSLAVPRLIGLENTESCNWSLRPDFFEDADSIVCRIGIDSVLNVAGVMGGDLDPINGMYWTWQSGYINIKIEGASPACPARKNQFQYHLGGYAKPYANWQEIVLPVMDRDSIQLNIDFAPFIEYLDLENENHVMSPSDEAVDLAKQFADLIIVVKND